MGLTSPVTARQRQVLRLIVDLSRKHQRPPTWRELSAALDLAPTGSRDHINRLIDKGQLERERFTCRTLKVTSTGYRTLGLWCPACESVAFELYAIPGVFTARCIPCARASLRIDEGAALVT